LGLRAGSGPGDTGPGSLRVREGRRIDLYRDATRASLGTATQKSFEARPRGLLTPPLVTAWPAAT